MFVPFESERCLKKYSVYFLVCLKNSLIYVAPVKTRYLISFFRETSSFSKQPLNFQSRSIFEGGVLNKDEWIENSTKRVELLKLLRAILSILKTKLQAIWKV